MDYLLDTNICIFHFRSRINLSDHFDPDQSRIMISEITLAELKFGVKNAVLLYQAKHAQTLEYFVQGVSIVPIRETLDIYAEEKVRLRRAGQPIDDFDLLIAATALTHQLTLVTNNTKHFARIEGLSIEDWTKPKT